MPVNLPECVGIIRGGGGWGGGGATYLGGGAVELPWTTLGGGAVDLRFDEDPSRIFSTHCSQ